MAGTWTSVWRRRVWARVASLAVISSLPAAAGCGAFFKCEGKTSCGTSGLSDTGDVVFVSNQSSTNIYAYFIASDGSLNAVSGQPYAVAYAPTAMAVTPDDSVLYVSTVNGIISYVVSSTGALSNATSRSTNALGAASMVVSPNGKWVLTLDQNNVTSSPLVRAYSVDTGGALGSVSNSAIIQSNLTITSNQIAVSPDGKYVGVAAGNAGTLIWQFDQTAATSSGKGALTYLFSLGLGSATAGDNSVAFDSADNIYIARNGSTTGLAVYAIDGSSLTPSAGPYTTGSGPRSLTFAASNSYLYDTNQADSTLSAFTNASATLKTIGTATAGPANAQVLALDKTGNYLLGAGTSSTAGLQIFTIGTSGGLTAGKTAQAGSANGIPVLAVTH